MSLLEKITIHQETPKDYREVEELTRETFWDLFKPGCDEHLMVHQLRKGTGYIPELSLVACDGNKIVGHILYTRSYVVSENKQRREVISFGPVSVLPSYQGKGIGSALIEKTKEIARDMGYKGIFIYGNPKYYNRFGFVNTECFHITTPEGTNFDAFMGCELYENALKGVTGKMYNDSGFEINAEVLEVFEKTFPFKEKLYGRTL